jgi:hypothetical protein
MISKRVQVLAFFCFVLVWDLTAVRGQDAPPSPTDTSISRCDVLPVAMRYRLQALEQIEVAMLPTEILAYHNWLDRPCVNCGLLETKSLRLDGTDSLYRLKSLQR